MSVALPI